MKTNVGMMVVLLLLIVAAPIGGSQGIKANSEHHDMKEADVSSYVLHEPIIVEGIPTTPDDPYIIEGYEITNPDGPGIQIRNVAYVIIRNNYIHDCGTKISEQIQEDIGSGKGDARLSMMSEPFKTGGIMVFNAEGSVEIRDNEVVNNDFGIRVVGHEFRPGGVDIYNNTVHDNHRAYFVSVSNADNVNIYNNDVRDNGLSMYIDNEGLQEAFDRGEDFPDGRTQGIITDNCSHVKTFDNTVINSNSDGIAAVGGDDDFAEDIEIFNNTVLRNGEQGLWLGKAKNGRIHHNVVSQNSHRIDTTGGSSGIMFDGNVYNFEVFDNDVAYNDAFGVFIIASSDNIFHNNEIHHNGDGAFGWKNMFHFSELENPLSSNNIIRDNNVHHNRVAVFGTMGENLGITIVEDNIFGKNGGAPIHYADYDDFDVSAHPEDWEYEGDSVFFNLKNEEQREQFKFGTNTVDGKEVTGNPESEEEPMEVETKEEEGAPPESAIEGIEVPFVPTDEETTSEGPRVDKVSITVGIIAAVVVVGLLVFLLVRRRDH